MGKHFTDEMTLAQARDVLRTLIGEGESCPCCSQFAKVYKRRITSPMARALLEFRKATPDGSFAHLPTILQESNCATAHGDFAKLRYWGVIEEELAKRPDGGRSGWWRITAFGEDFIAGRVSVPKYAHIYDGRCLGIDGDQVMFSDALGVTFHYNELMGTVGEGGQFSLV